jgi:hypothetical protein
LLVFLYTKKLQKIPLKMSTNDLLNHHQNTLDQFIKNARIAHNDKFEYSLVKYINGATKVTSICNTHGNFEQTHSCYLHGYGCPKCVL